MRADPRTGMVAVWAALVALTGLSWWLGAEHGAVPTVLATTVVLVVATVKVGLIGHTFMELGHAARLLRGLFFGLATLVGASMVGIYLAV